MDKYKIFTIDELDEELIEGENWEESWEEAVETLIEQGLVKRVYINGEENIQVTEKGLEVANGYKKRMH